MTLIAKTNGNNGVTLVEFSTVLGGFVTVRDRDSIRATASRFGDRWKQGYSGNTGVTKDATEELNAKGVQVFEGVSGVLSSVRYDEGTDGRNVYRKVRIALTAPEGKTTVTVPLSGDVAPRLLTKLANAVPGQFIQVKAWMSTVEKGGITYANASVSVKDADNAEVPTSDLSVTVKAARENARNACASMGLDPSSTSKAVRTAVEKLLMDFVKEKIEPKFGAPASTDSDQTESVEEESDMTPF